MEKVLKITEEPTKEVYLQSRIDQQVELICILKQRADEYLEKYMACEKEMKTLRKDLEENTTAYREEKKKCNLLQTNISKLEDTNLNLISSERILKQQNHQLMDKCNTLENEIETIDKDRKKMMKELE